MKIRGNIVSTTMSPEKIAERIGGTGGGGSSVLVVNMDEQMGQTSHNATQIYAHVKAGGTAVLSIDSYAEFIPLVEASEWYAMFGSFNGEESCVRTWVIYDDVPPEFYENYVLTQSILDNQLGNCYEALQNIIALQEGLLNVFTFTLSGSQLVAVAGMTWDDWYRTSYNTVGAYIDEMGDPCDVNGDTITLDGESGVRGLDNIGPYDYSTL